MSASASTSNLSVNEEKENVPPNDFQVLLNELGEIYVHITVNDDLIEKLKLKKDCALSYYDKYINIIPILEQKLVKCQLRQMEHERLLCERSNLRDQHRKLKNEKTDDFIKQSENDGRRLAIIKELKEVHFQILTSKRRALWKNQFLLREIRVEVDEMKELVESLL